MTSSQVSPLLTYTAFALTFAINESTLVAAVSLSSTLTTAYAPALLYISFSLTTLLTPLLLSHPLVSHNPIRLLFLSFLTLPTYPLTSALYMSFASPIPPLLLAAAAVASGVAAASLWSVVGLLTTNFHLTHGGGTIDEYLAVFNGCLLTVTLVVHLLTAMLVQEGVRVFLFLCTLSCGGVGMYLVLAWMTGDDLGRKDGEVTSLTAREAFRTTVEVTMNEAGLLALVPCHVAAGAIEAMVLGRGMEGFNVGLATGVKTVAGGLVSGLVAVGVGGKEGRRGKVIWIGFGVHFACAVLYGIGGSACGWTMFALGGAGQAIWANVSSGSAIASRVGALADGEKIRAFAFTKFCSGMSTSAGFFLMPVVVERGGLGVIVALIVAACAGGYGGLKRREVKYELLSNG